MSSSSYYHHELEIAAEVVLAAIAEKLVFDVALVISVLVIFIAVLFEKIIALIL